MAPPEENKLVGWKEIASYFRRDVTTVKRWAKTRGLPVHRLPGGARHPVFAYAEELQSWVRGARRNDVSPDLDSPLGDERAVSPPLSLPLPLKRRMLLSGWLIFTLTVGFVLGLSAGALILFRARPGAPVKVSFNGRTMSVWDAKGKVVWTYEFPESPEEFSDSEWTWRVQFVDDSSGHRILVAPHFRPYPGQQIRRHTLYSFSTDGKLLWHYEPELTLTFNGKSFGGPWVIKAICLISDADDKNVWVALNHSTWWPSFVARLDLASGRASVRFINPGWVLGLAHVHNSLGSYVLVGGVNNEYRAPALAVLDQNQASASSPPVDKQQFKCDGCSTGQLLRYVIFPSSELSSIEGNRYDNHLGFRVLQNEILVTIAEIPFPRAAAIENCDSIYKLSKEPDLIPVSYSLDDKYWDRHRSLEKEGKLNHSLETCRDHMPKKIRVWEPKGGWRDVLLRSGD